MTWLRTHLYAILLGAKGLLLAIVYFKGRRDARERQATETLKDYHDTRKRIDQVVRDHDQSDAADWLRERGERK